MKHRLALLASDFLQGLLYYYGIQIHHLTPKSVLHIAVFVHFCEAFLGIKPHFELFRSLYTLTPLPSTQEIGRIGCANLPLRPGMVNKYLEWPAIHVSLEWKKDWFYIGSPYPSLPKFSAEPPVYFHEWILKNGPGSEDQVEELLGFTFCLREIRVTATSVQFNWVMRRV